LGKQIGAYRVLVGKPDGKRPLRRPRCRWEGNIKMHLKEIDWEGVDRIDLVHDRKTWRGLVTTVINVRIA
jgi:hypothetical protein